MAAVGGGGFFFSYIGRFVGVGAGLWLWGGFGDNMPILKLKHSGVFEGNGAN